MRNFILLCFVSLLGFSQAQATGPNLLTNGDFEAGGTGWNEETVGTAFYAALGSMSPITPPADSEHGTTALVLSGQSSGSRNQTLVFQDGIPVTPGDLFEACTEAQIVTGNEIVGGNQGFIRLAFFDEMGVEVAGFNSNFINTTSPTDEWIDLCLSVIAPEGAVTAGMFIFFQQTDGVSPGVLFYDNAFLCVTAAAPIPTLETWGLIILGLGMSIVGIVYLAQRKSAIQVG